MYTLRSYQQVIVTRMIDDSIVSGNSIVVAPTGSGKSVIIAEVATQLDKPILIFQPSKEILLQNKEKLISIVDSDDVGVFSASVGEKTIKKYTLCTIGSVYKKPELFKEFGMVLMDECHLYNPKKVNTMYNKFFRQAGISKVIGLTATPWRMETWTERHPKGYFIAHTSTKLINRHQNPFWSRILATISVRNLIEAGYLVPLNYMDKQLIPDSEMTFNTSKTDYNLTSYQKKLKGKEKEIVDSLQYAKDTFNHVLVFCASVQQAEYLKTLVSGAVVTSDTPVKLRDQVINDFKLGKIKVVYNFGCLTTGFDFPQLDCIVSIRPTQSLQLHAQMLGRGVRTSPGKKFCTVIDLAGNVNKLGKVEDIRVVQTDHGWDIQTDKGFFHNRELYKYIRL